MRLGLRRLEHTKDKDLVEALALALSGGPNEVVRLPLPQSRTASIHLPTNAR